MKMKRWLRLPTVIGIALLFGCWSAVTWGQSGSVFLPLVAQAAANSASVPQSLPNSVEQQVIDLILTLPRANAWLDKHPGWTANVYASNGGENIWQADFCLGTDCNEWLGYGKVNLATGEVIDSFFPTDLSPEEFAAGKEKIERFLQYDPEIQTRLGNPELWYYELNWNRWDQLWEAYYAYGLDAFTVRLSINSETGKVEFNSIVNPNEMDEETKAEEQRNQARQLVWQAEGVGEAVAGYDSWKTYVERQGGGLYTVAFVADGRQLFSALLDIDSGKIIESSR
jgi:hypothetical protein